MGAAAGPITAFLGQAVAAGTITAAMWEGLIINVVLTGLSFEEDGEIWVARRNQEDAP